MKLRRGYVLLGLLLFFTVLGLSGTVGILEQDTRLKRFSEEDLKLNLDALRRAIDLYRYKNPDDKTIDGKMAESPEALADFLASESFVRARVATGTMGWRIIKNLIKNSSFERDDYTVYDDAYLGGWHGNHTANDGIPNGWKLKPGGAEQKLKIDATGTYIISFWARAENSNASASLKVRVNDIESFELIEDFELIASSTEWKRYFRSFPELPAEVPASAVVSIELSTGSGDATYIDGLMLEKWDPPPPTDPLVEIRPVPSAWTDEYQIIAASATEALQERAFKAELTAPAGSDISSYSWWFQW